MLLGEAANGCRVRPTPAALVVIPDDAAAVRAGVSTMWGEELIAEGVPVRFIDDQPRGSEASPPGQDAATGPDAETGPDAAPRH